MNKGHLSYSDRLAIEKMLDESHSIKEIENDIKRDSSIIIREINKHNSLVFPGTYNNQHPCLKYHSCNVKEFDCFKNCKNAEFKPCPKLNKSPHICNGCNTKMHCRFVKKYYKAREAHDEYKLRVSECRMGLHYSEWETIILNERLCPLIIRSKSVYHAVTAINKELNSNFVLKTIYRQIKDDYLPIKSSDLPRSRRKKKEKVDTSYKRDIKGCTYEDYKDYKKNNSNAIEMQMDTVEGIKENNAPVLLTLEIVPINFLFIFKIDSQNKEKVIKKLNDFKNLIGQETFDKLMEILLTDNGKEFYIGKEVFTLSSNIHLFYCHPYSSYEKGSIENNHELIRRIIPKGVSLKPYTQNELNLLCSHINSLFREKLKGKCPFDLIEQYIPLDKIKKLGLSKINPLDVCLIPELLGDKNINNIKKYLDSNDIKKANISFLKND